MGASTMHCYATQISSIRCDESCWHPTTHDLSPAYFPPDRLRMSLFSSWASQKARNFSSRCRWANVGSSQRRNVSRRAPESACHIWSWSNPWWLHHFWGTMPSTLKRCDLHLTIEPLNSYCTWGEVSTGSDDTHERQCSISHGAWVGNDLINQQLNSHSFCSKKQEAQCACIPDGSGVDDKANNLSTLKTPINLDRESKYLLHS